MGLIDSLCSVFPCTSEQYIIKAKRPAFSLLSKEKVKRVYGITIPAWDESLKIFMKDLTQETSVLTFHNLPVNRKTILSIRT